jgi:hypothetical protein
VVQRQAEDVLVEVTRFLGVLRAVRKVVQLMDGRRGRQRGGIALLQDGGHGVFLDLLLRNAFTIA